eukprot:Gb_37737 [translate_table: standard]
MAHSFIEENVPLNTEDGLPPSLEFEVIPASTPKFPQNRAFSFFFFLGTQLVDDLDNKLENSEDYFQSHILEMVEAYNDISFTTSHDDVEGKVMAGNWLMDALDRYSLHINIFLQEQVEKSAARYTTEYARVEVELNVEREADEIPREEVVFLLVQREVDKSTKSLSRELKLIFRSAHFHGLMEEQNLGEILVPSIVDRPKREEKSLVSRKRFMY